MTIHATPEELAAYLDPDTVPTPAPPANASILLRSASALVDDAVRAALYDVDPEGVPYDTGVREALRDATLEQSQAWHLHGIDPRLGASQAQRRVASKSLAGASVSYVADGAADTALSQLAAADSLTPAALGILSRAGLISSRVLTGWPSSTTGPTVVTTTHVDGGNADSYGDA